MFGFGWRARRRFAGIVGVFFAISGTAVWSAAGAQEVGPCIESTSVGLTCGFYDDAGFGVKGTWGRVLLGSVYLKDGRTGQNEWVFCYEHGQSYVGAGDERVDDPSIDMWSEMRMAWAVWHFYPAMVGRAGDVRPVGGIAVPSGSSPEWAAAIHIALNQQSGHLGRPIFEPWGPGDVQGRSLSADQANRIALLANHITQVIQYVSDSGRMGGYSIAPEGILDVATGGAIAPDQLVIGQEYEAVFVVRPFAAINDPNLDSADTAWGMRLNVVGSNGMTVTSGGSGAEVGQDSRARFRFVLNGTGAGLSVEADLPRFRYHENQWNQNLISRNANPAQSSVSVAGSTPTTTTLPPTTVPPTTEPPTTLPPTTAPTTTLPETTTTVLPAPTTTVVPEPVPELVASVPCAVPGRPYQVTVAITDSTEGRDYSLTLGDQTKTPIFSNDRYLATFSVDGNPGDIAQIEATGGAFGDGTASTQVTLPAPCVEGANIVIRCAEPGSNQYPVTVNVPDSDADEGYQVTINGETLPLGFVDDQYQLTVLVEGTPGARLDADLTGGDFGGEPYRVSTTFPEACAEPAPVTTTLPTGVQGTQLPRNFQPAGVQSQDIPNLARTGFASAWVLAGLAMVFFGSMMLLVPGGSGRVLFAAGDARRTGVDQYGRKVRVRRDVSKAVERDRQQRNGGGKLR